MVMRENGRCLSYEQQLIMYPLSDDMDVVTPPPCFVSHACLANSRPLTVSNVFFFGFVHSLEIGVVCKSLLISCMHIIFFSTYTHS